MKKYISVFQLPEDIRVMCEQLAIHWHGMLYEKLEAGIARQWHDSAISPFAVHALRHENIWHVETVALTSQAIEVFDELFFDWQSTEWTLYLSKDTAFRLQQLYTQEFGEQEMAHVFYREEPPRCVKLAFQSATTFKVQGQYQLFPDVRLIFQSLMMKHTWITTGEYEADEEMLAEILKVVRIVDYRLKSRKVTIHGVRIIGFVGEIQLNIRGNDTLRGYIHLLLRLSEFSGVGIKSALGMGKCQVTNIRRG